MTSEGARPAVRGARCEVIVRGHHGMQFCGLSALYTVDGVPLCEEHLRKKMAR